MPGVNLDLPPAEPPESPDSLGAESGVLEEAIGDLLAQEQMEVQQREVEESDLEVALRCAVAEFHGDLQALGKRLDARMEEALTRVAPLATAVTSLQEDNLRIRIQQERLARQVENLCKMAGIPESLIPIKATQEESSSHMQLGNNTPPGDPEETSSDEVVLISPNNTPSSGTTETISCPNLDSPSHQSQEPESPSQSLDTMLAETNAQQNPDQDLQPQNDTPAPPDPMPPSLGTPCQSSEPSLTAGSPCSDSTMQVSHGVSINMEQLHHTLLVLCESAKLHIIARLPVLRNSGYSNGGHTLCNTI